MFKNEPASDFSIEANRLAFAEALKRLDDKIAGNALDADPIINGQRVRARDEFERKDPSNSEVILGRTNFADSTLAEQAIQSLCAGQASWAATPIAKRSEVLFKTADLMRHERFNLAALIVRESGKPWKEADADVAEAIDFCAYYAEQMLEIGAPRKTYEVMGEDNVYFYQPRGLVAVIAPWNFPLAIACGMAVAALVTGNVVALKPAEQTSLVAFQFVRILLNAGLPENALAFLPGYGEVVGRYLVNHPLTDMICFTGSKTVGLEIMANAVKIQPGQRSIKKVVAELGGKNAIIIDEDADLDEAVKGVIASAFGYAGQKCSACSRAIAVGDSYEPFVRRLCEAASDLIIGPAIDPSTFMGPVIDQESQMRINQTVKKAEGELKIAFKGTVPNSGYFVPPVIFRDVDTQSAVWREEIFGPVLACTQASDFAEAMQVANDSQYALTGALFSRSPENIEKARMQYRVGNLYINRGCTGALVARQPFGGFKMSGVGSKAGGPDYLVQFMEPRTVTENTMRRGFAPDLP